MNNYIVSCMTTDFNNDIYEQAAPVGFATFEEAVQYAKDEIASVRQSYDNQMTEGEDTIDGIHFYHIFNNEVSVEYRIDKL